MPDLPRDHIVARIRYVDLEHNQQIIDALTGKKITEAFAPYGGTGYVGFLLDNNTLVKIEASTDLGVGVLRVVINGELAT